jgi:HEAT repeat protein
MAMGTNEQTIGIFTTDADLVVRSWDDWLTNATGIDPETARGQYLEKLFPELVQRGMLARFKKVLAEGVVEILAPALHHYLIPCRLPAQSKHFDKMQQRATIAPLRDNDTVVGVIVKLEDVTARLDWERDLAEQVRSENEESRLRAAQVLGQEAVLESTEPLLTALADESWRVRGAAVDGLARPGRGSAVEQLVRALRRDHRNPAVLSGALQLLSLSGVDAVEPLIECLRGPDTDLRIYAALALGDQNDPRVVPALMSSLEDDNPNVRFHAIESLGKLHATDAVVQLAKAALSGDFYLAFPALDALKRIGDSSVAPKLVPLLEDRLTRGVAAETLGALGDDMAVGPLVALLNTPQAPVAEIAGALAALHNRYEGMYQQGEFIAELSRRAIEPLGLRNLLGALETTDGKTLRAVVLVLGWMQGEGIERALARTLGEATARAEVVEALVRSGSRATAVLIEQMESEDRQVRESVIVALGRIGDPQAVPALLKTMATDPDLLIVAAGSLAKIGDDRAFDALVGYIGHPDASVRQGIVSAINSIGSTDMRARAPVLLKDPSPLVRESAVKVAGYFGYPECTHLLLALCMDPDEGVRRAVLQHLPYLDDDRVVPTLAEAIRNGTAKERATAAQALAQVEASKAGPLLLASLKDPDEWVQYFSARAIGRLEYSEGLDALTHLAEGDAPGQVRIAAIESLGSIGGPKAVAVLARMSNDNDPDIARAAVVGMGLIAHPDALHPLLDAVRSADPSRRVDALIALGKRGGEGAPEALQWAAAADSEPAVIQAAIDSLRSMGTSEAIASLVGLLATPARREACIISLSRLARRQQIEMIGHGLTHAQTSVRVAVVEVLERIKNPVASQLLVEALDDEQPAVRLAAAAALGRLGSRLAERKLLALANEDPDTAVRRVSKAALER